MKINYNYSIRLIFFVMFSCFFTGCQVEKTRQPRQIILLTVDTLRADHLGCYGYEKNVSPVIDAFADRSTLFLNPTCQAPWTLGSFGSMLSGRYASEILVDGWQLDADVPMLAEMMKDQGFQTLAVVSNPKLAGKIGFNKGFDRFIELFDQNKGKPSTSHKSSKGIKITADRVTDEVLSLLNDLKDEDFFLWIVYFDTHTPYVRHDSTCYSVVPDHVKPFKMGENIRILSEEEERKARKKYNADHWHIGIAMGSFATPEHRPLLTELYDSEIRFLDRHVGRLLEGIEKREMFDDSLIVFTSDHGESFFDHSNYFGHGAFPYQASSYVPLVIHWPETSPGVVDEPVALLDVLPTVLDYAGVSKPAFARGKVLRPKSNEAPQRILIETSGWYYNALRKDSYKLISFGEDHKPNLSLYNLDKDKDEHSDLALKQPDLVSNLVGELANELGSLKRASSDVPMIEVEPEILEQMRSLGYVE